MRCSVPSGESIRQRKAPPGWNAIVQDGSVKPCGPHQRTRCSGWLHTLKTSARGAARVRVITRTRSSGLAPLGPSGRGAASGLAAIVVSFLGVLHLQLVEIVLQPVEALLPELPIALKPARGILQRRGIQPAGPPLRQIGRASCRERVCQYV